MRILDSVRLGKSFFSNGLPRCLRMSAEASLLLPPHRHALQEPAQCYPLGLVPAEDLADQVGTKEGEIEMTADEGGVQADCLGEFGHRAEPAVLEQGEPSVGPGYRGDERLLDGRGFLALAVGQDDLLATRAALELHRDLDRDAAVLRVTVGTCPLGEAGGQKIRRPAEMPPTMHPETGQRDDVAKVDAEVDYLDVISWPLTWIPSWAPQGASSVLCCLARTVVQ